ncbi:MAG: family 78 glycoside hydrolase catalytic domain [Lentisphaeria bacterium]|nr:family 78 glycoside hydrolase catalytic domain [Lentisphaeria bacterium]
MKILSPRWIAPAGVSARRNCHFVASRTFELDRQPDSLFLDIACESYYLLKVNDVVVGRGPARGTSFTYYYDRRQIASCVHAGVNRITVEVHCMNVPTGRNVPAEPALWVKVGEILGTDASWECRFADREYPEDAPFYNMQQGLCEWRDLRFADTAEKVPTVLLGEDSGVLKRKFLPNDTPPAEEKSHLPAECLYPAFVPPADLADKKIAVLGDREPHAPVPEGTLAKLNNLIFGGDHAVELPPSPDGGGFTVIFNFARLISGRLELELTAPAGTVVDIAHEEELFQKTRLRSDHTATNFTYNLSDRYILRDGRQTVGNYMFDRGFRMVRLTFRNYGSPVILHRMRGVDRRYPLTMHSRFFCSDWQLNRLWETAFETISACTTDVFTDCPWRERLFFTNDFVVENRSALQLTGDAALAKHAFRMIFDEADEKGIFPCVIPSHRAMFIHHGFPKKWGWILSCNLTLPLSVLEYLLWTGDGDSVREWYPVLRRMIATFRSWKTAEGLLDTENEYNDRTDFFDWSFELNGKQLPSSGNSLMNAMYIIALMAMERLRDAAGCPDDGYAKEIAEMRETVVRRFYLPEKKVLMDAEGGIMDKETLELLGVHLEKGADFRSSRLAQALGLLAEADRAIPDPGALQKALLDDGLFPPELFYGSFILLAMKKCGFDAEALAYIRKYWGPVLDSGTPTLWENGVYTPGKAGFGGSASLCHGFSTSPVDFLQTVILGVTPEEPGFAAFRFAPDPCGLRFAHGSVMTPRGAIRASWKIAGNAVEAELFVPEGCRAVTPAGTYGPGDWQITIPQKVAFAAV